MFWAKTRAKKWGQKKGPKMKAPPGTHSACPEAPSFWIPFFNPLVWTSFLGMSGAAAASHMIPETMM